MEICLGSWSFIRHHWSYNSWIEYQWTLSWTRQCKKFLFVLIEKKRKTTFSFQFGNTCYCNSVLQALYFCKPFRERVLNYRLTQKNKKENLLFCLADLFHMIVSGKRRTGALQPKKFINKLRKENSKTVSTSFSNKIRSFWLFLGTFDNDMQQDAHEFLNHLLNTCADILTGKNKTNEINWKNVRTFFFWSF